LDLSSSKRSIANMSDCQDDFTEEWTRHVDDLKDILCAKIFTTRLTEHLAKFSRINPNDEMWRFMYKNLTRMAVIVKMLGYVRDDQTLRNTESHEPLFRPQFLLNHEMLQEMNSDQHGAYLMINQKKGVIIRAGSASSKFGHPDKNRTSDKGRINGHIAASMKQSNSVLYNSYPHKDSQYKIPNLQKGLWQDLAFIPALRFKDEDKVRVQSLFDWEENVLHFLDARKPIGCRTLEDKKHRLICYLFETTLQLCLSPFDNISQNPGCESFALVWDGGYEDVDMNIYTRSEDTDAVEIEEEEDDTVNLCE